MIDLNSWAKRPLIFLIILSKGLIFSKYVKKKAIYRIKTTQTQIGGFIHEIITVIGIL